MTGLNQQLIDFLNKSHSDFNVVKNEKEMLLEAGFEELLESKMWTLQAGKKYFLTRNSNTILAFKIPEKIDHLKFSICASHNDSPAFKLKDNPTVFGRYQKLKVESYGGLIQSTWLDKPLSVAGRLLVEKSGKVYEKIIDIDKNLAIIPNVCIHQNRNINNGFVYNNEIDMMPIVGLGEGNLIEQAIEKELDFGERIISQDLYLYNRDKADFVGVNDDFICSPRLDDLSANFVSLKAFIDAKNVNTISFFVAFANEESGSESYSGADSNILNIVLKRIIYCLGYETEELYAALRRSFMLSVDNGHAIHPNHPEFSDVDHPVVLNGGVVIKFNTNMRYTTDAISAAVVKALAERIGVPTQDFYNRADMKGGSTLGNISMKHVSILTADIGLPQLAMHSNYETMGSKDTHYLYDLCKKYYETNIRIKEGEFEID